MHSAFQVRLMTPRCSFEHWHLAWSCEVITSAGMPVCAAQETLEAVARRFGSSVLIAAQDMTFVNLASFLSQCARLALSLAASLENLAMNRVFSFQKVG